MLRESWFIFPLKFRRSNQFGGRRRLWSVSTKSKSIGHLPLRLSAVSRHFTSQVFPLHNQVWESESSRESTEFTVINAKTDTWNTACLGMRGIISASGRKWCIALDSVERMFCPGYIVLANKTGDGIVKAWMKTIFSSNLRRPNLAAISPQLYYTALKASLATCKCIGSLIRLGQSVETFAHSLCVGWFESAERIHKKWVFPPFSAIEFSNLPLNSELTNYGSNATIRKLSPVNSSQQMTIWILVNAQIDCLVTNYTRGWTQITVI